MSLAVRLAMLDTRLPLTIPSESEEGIGSGDFDVDDDFGNARPIKSSANLPLLTIINHIGTNIVFDASQEEEAIMTGRYLVSVTEAGNVSHLRNLETFEPREGVQGRQDQRGISEEDIQRGLQEGLDVSASIFKHVRAHIEEPVNLFEVL